MRQFPSEQYTGSTPGYYDLAWRKGHGVQWFWHEVRFRAVEEFLPARLRRILDLGCGPGTFLGRLPVGFEEGLGLDLSPGQIAWAAEHYGRPGLAFQCADVRELSSEEPFDAVTSIEVIEHLPEDAEDGFLSSVRRLLVPGGRFVLTTPNYSSAWPVVERLVSQMGPIDYRVQHINPFTPDRLHRRLERAGFIDVEIRTFFVAAPFLAAINNKAATALLSAERRWLPRWGMELVAAAVSPGASACQ